MSGKGRPCSWVANFQDNLMRWVRAAELTCDRAALLVAGRAWASHSRGPGRKPGAFSYTLTRLSLSLSLISSFVSFTVCWAQ